MLSFIDFVHERMQNQSNLDTPDGRLWSGSLCTSDELELDWISGPVVLTANGLMDDRRDSGPSTDILRHSASQLLMTSVNLPLSSPISTCNE